MTRQVGTLIRELGHDGALLASKIEDLAQKGGVAIYQEALRHMAGKNYDPATARLHWERALAHQARLFPEDSSFDRFRIALLDYLYNVAKELKDPRIVEADHLDTMLQASVTDGLTGLYHQTYFKAHLEKLVKDQGASRNNSFAVVLLDLDHFKQYNDRCGHLAGDEALKEVSEILKKSLRQSDLACRYGGEEFALLLHGVDAQQAFSVIDDIRIMIEQAHFYGQKLLDRGNLTTSGGIAMFPANCSTASGLLAHADSELYHAKEMRNTICPSANGQRRLTRHPLQSLVEFALEDGEIFHTGMSLDISPTGLGIACSVDQLPLGTQLQLRFRQPFWPADCQMKSEVRNLSVANDNGLVRLGLEFVEAPGEIRSLLPKRQPKSFRRTDNLHPKAASAY